MKKFTKLFLSCAAIAALTATVAVSAMADEVTVNMKGEKPTTATYDTETGKITFNAPEDIAADKAATFVVFPSDANATELAATDIVAIDQTASGVRFDKSGVKGKPEAADEKTYTVKLGYFNTDGQFKILEGTLFGSGVEIGNVNGDEAIDPADAVLVVQHFGGVITLTGDQYTAANANGDEAVDPADAVCIVRRFAGLSDGIGNIEPPQN